MLTNTSALLNMIKGLVEDKLIPLAFVLALLFFFWGVAKFVRTGAPSEKQEGKSIMVWGIIALFVISSVWGLVRIIQFDLGVKDNTPIDIPKFK